MTSTSYSETSSYLRCRRNHYYGYGKSLERIETSDSLGMGKALHSALEVYYRYRLDGMDHVMAADSAIQQYVTMDAQADNRQDLAESLRLYFEDEPFVEKGWKVIGVEQEYVLQYDEENDLRLPAIIDLLLMDPQGRLVVVDHKTGYEFLAGGSDEEYLQPQIPLYIAVLRGLGYRVAYGVYNQFRTRKIKAPSRDQLLRVVDVEPTAERVRRTFLEQTGIASEIDLLKALPLGEWNEVAYRTSNKMVCNSCPFKELCIADLMGANSALIESTQYKKRERRAFAVTAEME